MPDQAPREALENMRTVPLVETQLKAQREQKRAEGIY
jgi:hypothetical protein